MSIQSASTAKASRIVRDPRILGGEPVVAGTRTSVRSIVLAAREEGTIAGVLTWYPHLSADDVADALAYYQRHQRHQGEVDRSIARNRDTR